MTSRRRYDHRIRDHVARTGNVDLFPELDIPRSTARSWVRRGPSAVVSLEHELDDVRVLRERLVRVERRLAIVNAVMTLLLAMIRTLDVSLARTRVPEGADKARLLTAIERARRALPLGAALRVMGLTASRYHAWVRAQEECDLDDRASCPGATPHRLTADELMAMKELACSPAHRHMSVRALALFAQRAELGFAHPVTGTARSASEVGAARARGCIRASLARACAPPLPTRRGTSTRRSSGSSTGRARTCTPSSTISRGASSRGR